MRNISKTELLRTCLHMEVVNGVVCKKKKDDTVEPNYWRKRERKGECVHARARQCVVLKKKVLLSLLFFYLTLVDYVHDTSFASRNDLRVFCIDPTSRPRHVPF